MPKLTFTTQWVKWVKPPETGQVDYFDTWRPADKGMSFVLRVSYGGAKVWYTVYRLGGKWTRRRIGTYPALRLGDARDEAVRIAAEVDEQRSAAPARGAGAELPSFAELARDYVEQYARVNKRSWERDRQIVEKELLPRYGRRRFTAVSRWEVIEALEEIAATRPVWANRTLEIIRKMYNWSRNQRKYRALEYNPFSGIPKPGAEAPRSRTLSDPEIAALWPVFGDIGPAGSAFRLMLATGQRPGEVLSMRRQDIVGRWWSPRRSGSREAVQSRVYLTDLVLKEIDGMNSRSDWVFPSPTASGPIRHVAKAHRRVTTATGIDYRPNDLRRTVSSELRRLGIPEAAVERLLGNVRDELGQASWTEDNAGRDALLAWEDRLSGLLTRARKPALPSFAGAPLSATA